MRNLKRGPTFGCVEDEHSSRYGTGRSARGSAPPRGRCINSETVIDCTGTAEYIPYSIYDLRSIAIGLKFCQDMLMQYPCIPASFAARSN